MKPVGYQALIEELHLEVLRPVALHDTVEWFLGQFEEQEFLNGPDMLGQPGGHRRGSFQGVMHGTEIVDHPGPKQFIF